MIGFQENYTLDGSKLRPLIKVEPSTKPMMTQSSTVNKADAILGSFIIECGMIKFIIQKFVIKSQTYT